MVRWSSKVAVCTLVASTAVAAVSTASTASTKEAASAVTSITIENIGPTPTGATDPAFGKYGMIAAAKTLNADKSLGFKIKLKYCGMPVGGSANDTISCARKAAADESVVALTGGDPSGGATGASLILDDAGLPCISCDTFSLDTLATSKHWFQTSIGSLGVGGQAALAADLTGAKTFGLPYLDVPAGAQLPPLINGLILAPRDVGPATSVPIPATAADLSSQVAAMGDPDAIVEALTLDLGTRFTTTAAQQGVKGAFWLPGGVFPPSTIKKNLGSVKNKIYVASAYKLSGPGYQQYQKDMKAVGKQGTDYDDTQAVQSWLGVNLIAQIVQQLIKDGKPVTREGITDAARAMTSVDTMGLTPPLDWTQVGHGTFVGGAVPNVVNPFMIGYQYKNGKYVPLAGNDFINIFEPA